ncbi:hypothetical protein BS50DRAFT_676372 [Corynespora cassiicola Philippines]|uniref:Uncharacterized protein n=1 Tax=Corynespora cassiicola Philippines TaxID=1448308 RepID=A0A2T2NMD6_CORCC|nr:hypothetical protein BS50DRAFT_676372 [Corynespora cassiicola Philippines]
MTSVRFLAAIVLLSTAIDAVSLPKHVRSHFHAHAVLEPRDVQASGVLPPVGVPKAEPKTLFKQLGEYFRGFLYSLLGFGEEEEGGNGEAGASSTVVIDVTSTVVGGGPSSIVVSSLPETTSAVYGSESQIPASETIIDTLSDTATTIVWESSVGLVSSSSTEVVFSILPVYSGTTTTVPIIGTTSSSELSSALEPIATSSSVSGLPDGSSTGITTSTDLVISDPFIVSTLASVTVPLPWNTSVSSPLILTNPIRPTGLPEFNATIPSELAGNASTTRIRVTSTLVVTLTASPVIVTGTAGVSYRTASLTVVTKSLMYPNTTFSSIPLVTGTAAVPSNGTIPVASETPLYPNTTVFSSITLVTGTAPSVSNDTLPVIIETPLYPNTTFSSAPLVTGSAPLVSNKTSLVGQTEWPLYPNSTEVSTPTSVVLITGTGIIATTVASDVVSIPLPTETPLYPNSTIPLGTGTEISSSSTTILDQVTSTPQSSSTSTPTPNIETVTTTLYTTVPAIPLPTPTLPTSPSDLPSLSRLRTLCTSPRIRTITLPLLPRFYGPNGYPSLHTLPGCIPPTGTQAAQAPGLLNCTALGAEVDACQRNGRRVLLSVKGASGGSVGGNLGYGDPGVGLEPFGAHFPSPSASSFSPPEGLEARRQQEDEDEEAKRDRMGYPPNLFTPTRNPSALALTLHSLFGEGPNAPSSGPGDDDGVRWLSRPLGDEVVLDGFVVQVPTEWKGTYQGRQFDEFAKRLRALIGESWEESGGVKGGPGDLGADGKGAVVMAWN